MRKKNTQLQFAVICIFLFCFLNKKESHLNASESGIEASSLQQKAFVAVCYFIHTQCPPSCTPCCVCHEYSVDGLVSQVFQHDSAWLLDLA